MTDAERQAGRVADELTPEIRAAQREYAADLGAWIVTAQNCGENDERTKGTARRADISMRMLCAAIRGREGEDGRRLDWWDKGGMKMWNPQERFLCVYSEVNGLSPEGYGGFTTIREATDAAMSTTHPSTPEQP